MHFGRISDVDAEDHVEVDVGALVRRLILFDRVTVESVRLREVPSLVAAFGIDGLIDLIDAGAVTILCDAMTTGEIGRTAVLAATRRRGGRLPYGSYHLANVQIADRDRYVQNVLQEVHNAPVSFREAKRLKAFLAPRLARYPSTAGESAVTATEADLRDRHPVVWQAIRLTIAREAGLDIGPQPDFAATELEHDGDFRVDTRLQDRFDLSSEVEHRLVKRGILAVAGLNQRVSLMAELGGVTGLRDDEEPLFERKLSVLAARLNPSGQERRFDRIVAIGGMPSLDPMPYGTTIDVKRLQQLRSSEHVADFRAWLAQSDSVSDEEVQGQLRDLRDTLAWLAGSRGARVIRFLVATATGLVPGVGIAAGPALSAVDTFLLDKVIGKPGPASFIGRLYPSVFRDDDLGPDRDQASPDVLHEPSDEPT